MKNNKKEKKEKPVVSEVDSLNARVEKYKKKGGISTKNLNFVLWYLRNHRKFFLSLVAVLIFTALLLWGYTLFNFMSYIFVGAEDQKKNLAALSDGAVTAGKVDFGENFIYASVDVLPLSNGRYDLIGIVNNTNDKVAASFNYYFVADNEKVGYNTGFVLPNENKYIFSLGEEISHRPSRIELVIEGLSWKRINLHEIPNWQDFKDEHMNFVIKNREFLPADESGLSEKLKISNLRFTVSNETAYTYYQVKFLVLLYNYQNIVGVGEYVIDNFESKGEDQAELSLLGDFTNVNKIDIIPEVNILQEEVFGNID